MNSASGDYSLAAGYNSAANHNGSFVWSDSYTTTQNTTNRAHQFDVRAFGGARFEKDSTWWIDMLWYEPIETSTGAYLSWGGVWNSVSDRNAKENFSPVDGQQVLAQLAEVPVTSWNYKAEEESTRHIGPVAQDFYAAFGYGDRETSIGSVDADGVALAAIQGLYEINQDLESENEYLQLQVDNLEARLAVIESDNASKSITSIRSYSWLGLFLIGFVGIRLIGRDRFLNLLFGGDK